MFEQGAADGQFPEVRLSMSNTLTTESGSRWNAPAVGLTTLLTASAQSPGSSQQLAAVSDLLCLCIYKTPTLNWIHFQCFVLIVIRR